MTCLVTLQEVVERIENHKRNCDMYHEYTVPDQKFLAPHLGSFEAILSKKDGIKYLVPEHGLHLHFLYRGQNKEYIPCVPSLYRGNPSETEIFLNRMRLVAFERMLHSHPVVNGFFAKHGFFVDIEGLAQHYGLCTSILDLTSNLDVALFFATCKYDRDTDTYDYYRDEDIHEAILYVFDPFRDNEPSPGPNMFNYLHSNITPIGLQVFPRPGVQEGYALHIPKGGSVKSWMYRFSFTSADSKYYYDKFGSGEKLWIHDRLIPITKKIVGQKTFSFDVFNDAFERFRPKGFSRSQMKRSLRTLNEEIVLATNIEDVVFSKEDQRQIIEEWNNGLGKRVCDKIVRKSWYNHEGTDKSTSKIQGIHNRMDFMTFEHLSESVLLQLIAYPDGPEGAEWVNYTNTPRPSISKHYHDDGQWHKVEACINDVFGKTWLTEDDWRIPEI